MEPSLSFCFSPDPEIVTADEALDRPITLSIRELAALLTHADRSSSSSTVERALSVEPWKGWISFCRALARKKAAFRIAGDEEVEVGQVYKRHNRSDGDRWLVVEALDGEYADCRSMLLSNGVIFEEKKFRVKRSTLMRSADTYDRVERVGDGLPKKMQGASK